MWLRIFVLTLYITKFKSFQTTSEKPIEHYEYKDKKRLNNPPVGLAEVHINKGTESLPFTAGKAVAVKIIYARGIESFKIIRT